MMDDLMKVPIADDVITMTDYKELIAALREEAEAVQAIEWEIPICTSNHIAEAASVIEQLATDIDVAHKERDALLADFLKGYREQVQKEHGIYRCDICKYGFENNPQGTGCKKVDCDGYTNWEWRGVNDG